MNQDLSIVSLLVNASWVVQAVVVLLIGISIASWAAIFRKVVALKRAQLLNDEFDRQFWSGTSLNDLFAGAAQNAKTSGSMERIFASGMREYQKLRERNITDAGTLLDGARRAMRASNQREMDAIEVNLSFLATVGSVSPYVGLFGTVWGIMHAFTGLAAMEQVTLASVAPGIAEALVATACRPLRARHCAAVDSLIDRCAAGVWFQKVTLRKTTGSQGARSLIKETPCQH